MLEYARLSEQPCLSRVCVGHQQFMTIPDNLEKRTDGGGLARQLGLFGTVMAVMGGIIGARSEERRVGKEC